jgi:hypothetical protein
MTPQEKRLALLVTLGITLAIVVGAVTFGLLLAAGPGR